MPHILEEHKRVTVGKPGEIRMRIRGKDYSFRDLDSAHLQAGAGFLAYYDGENPEWLHLTDGQGRYVCSVRQAKAVRRNDHEALSEAIAARQRQLKQVTERVARRNADTLSNRALDIEHNIKVIQGAEDAINLVPVPAGAVEAAPLYAQHIDAVAQAQRDIADQQRRTEERIRAEHGSLDDLMPPEPEPDDFADDADDDLSDMDQLL